MKKFLCVLMVLVLIIVPMVVYADHNPPMNITDEYNEISYTDDGEKVLSTQKVFGDEAKISSIVPQCPGKIFCGWKAEGKKELLKPGQLIEVKDSIVLTAKWEDGNLPKLKLKAVSEKDSKVTFSLDFSYGGFMNYASYTVHTRNLTTAEENVFDISDGEITVDSLPKGQYIAYLLAKKYDIEYLSDEVNFVVLSGITAPDDTLKLVMDGKGLIFADEQPQLIGSYTYIAIRQFCESMDARVSWREDDRSATITLGGTIIKVFENSDECIVNGTAQSLPVKTIIKNGRMLLPLRSVAELCNAEIVWDDNRTVYIYRGSKNVFDENMMYIRTTDGRYLSLDDDGLALKKTVDFSCGWIFDVIPGASAIYTICNLADLEKNLQISDSAVVDGNLVIMDRPTDYDGHLWQLRENNDGTYSISPANNPELYFDIENLCLTKDAKLLDINYISSLEL